MAKVDVEAAKGFADAGMAHEGPWHRRMETKACRFIFDLIAEVEELRQSIQLRDAAHDAQIELQARLTALQNSNSPK